MWVFYTNYKFLFCIQFIIAGILECVVGEFMFFLAAIHSGCDATTSGHSGSGMEAEWGGMQITSVSQLQRICFHFCWYLPMVGSCAIGYWCKATILQSKGPGGIKKNLIASCETEPLFFYNPLIFLLTSVGIRIHVTPDCFFVNKYIYMYKFVGTLSMVVSTQSCTPASCCRFILLCPSG